MSDVYKRCQETVGEKELVCVCVCVCVNMCMYEGWGRSGEDSLGR